MGTSYFKYKYRKSAEIGPEKTGGINDVPGYPCKHCAHNDKCTNARCEEFQKFYRNFMRDFRDKFGVKQPFSLDYMAYMAEKEGVKND